MAYYGGIPRVPSPNPNPAPPSMYRSPSPNPVPLYRSASPIPTTATLQPQPLGANPGQIAPGTITYTTSYDPNGTLIYHPFRAVPVSYQTANGIVAGTQWVPADATTVLPAGAQPANADFAATWSNRNQPHNRDDDRALRDWQKDEDKRRRKEEKEAAKRVARAEKDRRERERESARSIYGGVPTVASSANSGYAPTAAYGSPYASPIADLERRFENTDISRKRGSIYADPNRPASPYVPPSPIASAANPGYAPAAGYYPSGSSPYRPPGALPGTYDPAPGHPRSRAPSPIPGAGPYSSRSRAPSPVPGPAGYGAPRSRAASPMPTAYVGAGYPPPGSMRPTASPRPGETMLNQPDNVGRLPPPDAFSRPPNMAQSYTWFELMKIQNMDTFYDQLPRMPLVLVPHDVYHEDWIRFMQDLALAWAGRLPAAAGSAGAQKGSAIAIDLIELWNQAFFTQRGVDVILYRGRERRTGRRAGQIDAHIPGFDDSDLDSDDSDSSSSSLSDSEDDDRRNRYAPGVYGSSVDPYAQAELRDAKRANKEKKAEKKRRRKEKKARKKAKEREKRYALYIAALTNDDLM